jgi:hypothetical protein
MDWGNASMRDDTVIPCDIYLPCGATATYDVDSGISYRCLTCFAVVGSIGQPDHCQEAANEWRVLERMGGVGWNYKTGQPQDSVTND